MVWFSTRLRFALLVEPQEATEYSDSVYVFQIDHDDDTDLWGEVLRHALRLGKQREQEYLNGENQRVCWRLKEVATLDMIRVPSLDDAEVYSEFVSLGAGEEIPFDAQFDPDRSRPGQTGI
jgi:hypothetical protein